MVNIVRPHVVSRTSMTALRHPTNRLVLRTCQIALLLTRLAGSEKIEIVCVLIRVGLRSVRRLAFGDFPPRKREDRSSNSNSSLSRFRTLSCKYKHNHGTRRRRQSIGNARILGQPICAVKRRRSYPRMVPQLRSARAVLQREPFRYQTGGTVAQGRPPGHRR